MLTYTGHSGSFSGNGRAVILTRDATTGEVFVHPGTGKVDGTRTFGAPVLIGTGFAADKDVWVGAGDFTGNGTADIFTLTVEQQAYIYLNKDGLNGLDTLAEPIHVGGKLPEVTYDTIALADLDQDGRTDIIGRQAGTSIIDAIPFAGSVDGTNSFAAPYRLAVIGETDIPVGAADVTGSGGVDLLVLHADGGLSALPLGGDEPPDTETGTWYRIGEGWDQMTVIDVTDLTGDGRPDLLGMREDGTVVAFLNTGGFDPADPASVFADPVVVATGWSNFNAIS